MLQHEQDRYDSQQHGRSADMLLQSAGRLDNTVTLLCWQRGVLLIDILSHFRLRDE